MNSPLVTHPNTTRSVGGGSVGIVVAWLLGLLHVPLSAEDGAAISTIIAGIVLFIGRDGIVGAWRRLLHGTHPPVKAPAKKG